MDRLPTISAQISEPGRTAAVADAISAAGDTVASLAQSDLVGSLTMLVQNLSIVVKIGDEVAKARCHALPLNSAHVSDRPADTPLGKPRLECTVSWPQGKAAAVSMYQTF